MELALAAAAAAAEGAECCQKKNPNRANMIAMTRYHDIYYIIKTFYYVKRFFTKKTPLGLHRSVDAATVFPQLNHNVIVQFSLRRIGAVLQGDKGQIPN